MSDDTTPKTQDLIESLITEEETAALDEFRKRDFRARVKERAFNSPLAHSLYPLANKAEGCSRAKPWDPAAGESRLAKDIRTEQGRSRALPRRAFRPLPIGAVSLLVCCILGYLLVARRVPINKAAGAFEQALSQMPGLQPFEHPAAAVSEKTGSGDKAVPIPLAAALASARVEMDARERAEIDLPRPLGDGRVPSLSLSEKFKILIMDKCVERALTLISIKSKEG
jgi:hypothetical protein